MSVTGNLLSATATAIATAIAGLAAAPATAAVYTVHYSGTLTSSFDETGVFGAPLTGLNGLGFTISLTYDTALGTRTTNTDGDIVKGGQLHGNASPVTAATVTVNGVTRSFLTDFESIVQADALGPYALSRGSVTVGQRQTMTEIEAYASLPDVLTSLDTRYPATQVIPDPYAYFLFSTFDTGTGQTVAAVSGQADINAPFFFSVVGVPEPASWALLIAGFGLVGGAARRQRAAMARLGTA